MTWILFLSPVFSRRYILLLLLGQNLQAWKQRPNHRFSDLLSYSLHSKLPGVLSSVKVKLLKSDQICRKQYQHLRYKINVVTIAAKYIFIFYAFDTIDVHIFHIYLVLEYSLGLTLSGHRMHGK
jgi:hypothetical protein